MSKRKIMYVVFIRCSDVLNITMHTEMVIHSMNAYVWCWSKICGSLDENFICYNGKL